MQWVTIEPKPGASKRRLSRLGRHILKRMDATRAVRDSKTWTLLPDEPDLLPAFKNEVAWLEIVFQDCVRIEWIDSLS